MVGALWVGVEATGEASHWRQWGKMEQGGLGQEWAPGMGSGQGGALTVMGSFSTRSPFTPFPASILRYKRLFSGNTETPKGLLRVHGSLPFTVGVGPAGTPTKAPTRDP